MIYPGEIMAQVYKFSEKEIEEIVQARRENKDKRVETRLKALEMRARNVKASKIAEATGSISDLSRILDCTENQVYSFIKGRAYASFAQISTLATELGATIEELLHGDERTYNATVVHCMNDFQDNKNRETILDLIDDYVDIVDAVLTQ